MGLVAAVSVVGMIQPPAQPSVGAPTEPGCTPVAIMAFRGSGEGSVGGQDYRGQASNGFEGPTLQRLLHEYAYSDLWDQGLAGVPIIGVSAADGYDAPAVDIPFEGTRLFAPESRIWQGATNGSIAAIYKMGEFQRAQPAYCPITQWVLVGYSQGAMAARWAFDTMGSRVASLYLVGDPFQKPNGVGTTGAGANGTGVLRFNWPGMRASLDSYYDRKPTTAMSLCHNNDIICDFGTYLHGSAEHENYYKTESEKKTQGKLLATIVKAAVDASLTRGRSRDVEIVMAVDTTGSMQPYIDDAVESARSLGERVLAISAGSRVGLVEYRDHGDSFVARTVVSLTRDVPALEAGLSGLGADEGGDTPEAVYSGIVEAGRAAWRPATTRAIAVLGDAPAHDPEDVTGYTAAGIKSYLRSIGAGVVGSRAAGVAPAAAADGTESALLFGLSADPDLTAQLQGISDEVGGGVFDIGSDGTVAQLLQDVVDEAASAPQVTLGVGPSLTGHDTVVTAAGTIVSDGPPVYDFDLDGDGAYETVNASPVQLLRLPAGPHGFGVRVTDAEGRVGQAVANTVTLEATAVLGGAGDLSGVSLKPKRGVAGKTVRVSVSESTASHAAALTKGPGKPLLAGTSIVAAGRPLSFRLPRTLRPGRFQVVVVGDDGRSATLPIQVRQRPKLRLKAHATNTPEALRLVVRVRAAVGRPAGKVVVMVSGDKVGSSQVRRGRAELVVRLAKLPPGADKVKLKVRFQSNKKYIAASRSLVWQVR